MDSIRGTVDAKEVISVLDGFADAHVGAWLDGGWGIDALLGEQTRPHDSVAVAVDTRNGCEALAFDVLAGRGYELLDERDRPVGLANRELIHSDPSGRVVELHPVEPGANYPLNPAVPGMLAGCTVPCLNVELQLATYEGTDLQGIDRDDVRKLCAHLGLWTDLSYDELDLNRSERGAWVFAGTT